MTRRLGTCPHCHRPHCVVKRGRIMPHGFRIGDLSPRCPGSGERPLRIGATTFERLLTWILTANPVVTSAIIGGLAAVGVLWLAHHFLG